MLSKGPFLTAVYLEFAKDPGQLKESQWLFYCPDF